jgi:hypothetical protein
LETKRKIKRSGKDSKLRPVSESGSPAGLGKSKKIIRAAIDREIQFLEICSQIKLGDCKKQRAENQKNERKAKRKKAAE